MPTLEAGQHDDAVRGSSPSVAAHREGQQPEPGSGNHAECPVRQLSDSSLSLSRYFRHHRGGALMQYRLGWSLLNEPERAGQCSRTAHGHRGDGTAQP